MEGSPECGGNIFGWGRLPVAGSGGWGKLFPRLQRIPGEFFDGAERRPGAGGSQGKPGEGGSHGCYTREPARSTHDSGVLPRSISITPTGYLSILGIAGGPDLPGLTPPTGH